MPRQTTQPRLTLFLPASVLEATKGIATAENTPAAEMIRRSIDHLILAATNATPSLPQPSPIEDGSDRFVIYMPEYMQQMLAWLAYQRGLTMHQLAAIACKDYCQKKHDLYAYIESLNQAAA